VFVQFDIARITNVLVRNPLFSSHFYEKKKLKHRYKEDMKERRKQERKKERKEEKQRNCPKIQQRTQ